MPRGEQHHPDSSGTGSVLADSLCTLPARSNSSRSEARSAAVAPTTGLLEHGSVQSRPASRADYATAPASRLQPCERAAPRREDPARAPSTRRADETGYSEIEVRIVAGSARSVLRLLAIGSPPRSGRTPASSAPSAPFACRPPRSARRLNSIPRRRPVHLLATPRPAARRSARRDPPPGRRSERRGRRGPRRPRPFVRRHTGQARRGAAPGAASSVPPLVRRTRRPR